VSTTDNTGVRVLYLDIETSPITAQVWGLWQQNVGINQIVQPGRIIGVGYKWRGQRSTKWVSEYDQDKRSGTCWSTYTSCTTRLMSW
jgi:hypothetical protein